MMACHHCGDPTPSPIGVSIADYTYCSEACAYCPTDACAHGRRKIARLERETSRLRERLRAAVALLVDIQAIAPRVRAQYEALLDELGRTDSTHERVTKPSLPPLEDDDDEPSAGDVVFFDEEAIAG